MKISTDMTWLADVICAPSLQDATDMAITRTTGLHKSFPVGTGVSPMHCRAIATDLEEDLPVLAWAWELLACRPGEAEKIADVVFRGGKYLSALEGPDLRISRARLDFWWTLSREPATLSMGIDLFAMAAAHSQKGMRSVVGKAEDALEGIVLPVHLLRLDDWRSAVNQTWDSTADILPDLPDLLSIVQLMGGRREKLRADMRRVADACFSLGTDDGGHHGIAWLMLSVHPEKPSTFHVLLPQLQSLVNRTWLDNRNRAAISARLRIWWKVAQKGPSVGDETGDIFRIAKETAEAAAADPGFESLRSATERVASKVKVRPQHGVVVMPHGKAEEKGLPTAWAVLRDAVLPRIAPTDVAHVRATLHDEYPFATAVVDVLLRDVRDDKPVRLQPTILVGSPGSGKSRFFRRLATLLNDISVYRYDCAASHDAMFSGSPKAWAGSQASVPARAILQSRIANPIVMLDEIEKAGSGTYNGRLWDALVSFTESETAARYRETGLDAELDLSHVSYVATANSVDALPGPLRDRFRIVKMPTPTLAHLPRLAGHVMKEIARDDDARAHDEPLADDELAIIGRAWASERFSMRKLQRIVSATLEVRDACARRH